MNSTQAQIQRRIESLRRISLFQDIAQNSEALQHLAEATVERSYQKGEQMIVEGKAGTELFLLIEGKASVFKATPDGELYKVAVIDAEQHAFFGEGGLLDGDARSATIQTETSCTCLVLEKAAFSRFGEKYPQWALPVMTRITQKVMVRLRKANLDLMLLYNALVAEVREGK